ncbi:putative prophage membrane protein [Cronobacter dublinensis 1210]|uniref:Prophage membrane protein n=1 Tax=Cronobacter dublinensis 1210 TaxID=1208656 RepID=A0ABP1WEP1_9ENTR|nr:putative prophage membrane protein [Cronobacter dublinensis 1210]
MGSKLASWTEYSDKPLDALGAVILSALTIRILTFASQQDPAQWFQRWRGGANGNK